MKAPAPAPGIHTSPTFTASGRAWRIVCVVTEDGNVSGWKAQTRRNLTPHHMASAAWEDWRETLPFPLPRAVREQAEAFIRRHSARMRHLAGIA